jgi:hypothetical protein
MNISRKTSTERTAKFLLKAEKDLIPGSSDMAGYIGGKRDIERTNGDEVIP